MPARKGGHEVFCGNWENGVDKRCDERYNLSCVCGRSSSGRARPCQGRGSEFEPRRPLQKETPSERMVFLFGIWQRAGLNSLPRPARSALNQEVRQGSREWLCHSWDAGKRVRASSILLRRARKIKRKTTLWVVFLFGMSRAGGELAASTGAQRVKSRGKGRVPANGSAIRGMPGSEFEPRLFCCAEREN